MNLFDETIRLVEKMELPAFDKKMEEATTISVEENEQLSRELWESKWKDDLRKLVEPIQDETDTPMLVQLVHCIMNLAAEVVVLKMKNSAYHHYFLKEIKSRQS